MRALCVDVCDGLQTGLLIRKGLPAEGQASFCQDPSARFSSIAYKIHNWRDKQE